MEEKLRQLQLIQLEILKFFDNFCREHNLKYSLYAGSLLGAIRHQGFIPWDDDADIAMLYEDYKRFIVALKQDLPQEYTFTITGKLLPTQKLSVCGQAVTSSARLRSYAAI